jgi:hypothetical protein
LSVTRLGHETMGKPVPPEVGRSLRALTRQLSMLATALSLTPAMRQRLFMKPAEESKPAGDDVWAQLRRFPGIGPA